MSQVSKIFITHMHADHTMGILTFLRNVLGIPKPKVPGGSTPPNFYPPRVEIFGPRGIRRMLRMLWYTTHTHSEYSYVVHELLFPGEQPSVPAEVLEEGADEIDVRRESECVGRDIWCDAVGYWRGIVDVPFDDEYAHWGAIVDAGPIEHRDPCIGYIIREVPRGRLMTYSPIPRKLVILGDTHDPSPIIPLVHSDPEFASVLPEFDLYGNGVLVRIPVTLLVHEATDAYIPQSIDTQSRTGRNRTHESVQAKTLERGHSTPAMAGAFARKIGAERLVMNHIGARFPAPDRNYAHGAQAKFRAACMREIERQAAEAWCPQRRMQPQAAWDFLSVALSPNQPRQSEEITDVARNEVHVGGSEERRGTGSTTPARDVWDAEQQTYEGESGRREGDGRRGYSHKRNEEVVHVDEHDTGHVADGRGREPQHGRGRKRRAYESVGGGAPGSSQMFTWRVEDGSRTDKKSKKGRGGRGDRGGPR